MSIHLQLVQNTTKYFFNFFQGDHTVNYNKMGREEWYEQKIKYNKDYANLNVRPSCNVASG